MKTPELKTATEITSMFERAVAGYCASEREMHEALFQCTVHALTHGDTTLLQRMLQSVCKKQVCRDMAAWVRHYGGGERKAIVANVSKDHKVTVRVGKMEDRPSFPIDEAWDNPYYNLIEPVAKATQWEREKAMLTFAKRVVKNDADASDDVLTGAFKDALKKARAA